MAFQQQESSSPIWVRLGDNSDPDEALTEPAAPQRVSYPGQPRMRADHSPAPTPRSSSLPPRVDFDEQITVTDPPAPVSQPPLPRAKVPAPFSAELSDPRRSTIHGERASKEPVERVSVPPPDTTLRTRESKVDGLRTPSSAVRCAIPVTLRMLTGNPKALVTLLDIDRLVVQAEHALPDQAAVWIRLPFASGAEVVRGRVTCSDRRTPSSPWEALVKLEVVDKSTRDGLVGLVRALKERSRR